MNIGGQGSLIPAGWLSRLAFILLGALLMAMAGQPPAVFAVVVPTGPTQILSGGRSHTCALTPAGAVDCWGNNSDGQAQDQTGPYTRVSAGEYYTCALTPAGAVDCWGNNFAGQGQDQPGPYAQVSASDFHTCALTPAGAVDCWGNNSSGESNDMPGPYTQVSVGYGHTCALTPGGAVDCWGVNFDGQAEDHAGPYTEVSLAFYHTCALTPAGAVDCWGSNVYGQAEDQPGPYTQVSAGGYHTCALTPAGAVDCWGFNSSGESNDQPGPTTQVSAGGYHNCALTPAGAVDCWGNDSNGQAQDMPGPYGPYVPPASLIIRKEVSGVSTGFGWSFAFSGDKGPFTLDKAISQLTFPDTAPGTYAINETAVAGYDTAVSCDNGDSSTNGDLTVTLADVDVTCTFLNTAQPGSITVEKKVLGIIPPWSYEFDGDLGLFYLTDSTPSQTFSGLEAGNFTMTETVENGIGVSVSCDNGAGGANSVTVTLDPGENVLCTFTNATDPASLTILKELAGDSPPATWSFDFTGDLGEFTLDKAAPQITFGSLPQGNYNLSETAVPGYETAVACDNGDSSEDGDLRVALGGGDAVTCTFTNTYTAPDGFLGWLPVIIR